MLSFDLVLAAGLLTCFAGSATLSAAEVSIVGVRASAVAVEAR